MRKNLADWWFGTFFIFPCIGNSNPNWLIFFRGAGIPPTSWLLWIKQTQQSVAAAEDHLQARYFAAAQHERHCLERSVVPRLAVWVMHGLFRVEAKGFEELYIYIYISIYLSIYIHCCSPMLRRSWSLIVIIEWFYWKKQKKQTNLHRLCHLPNLDFPTVPKMIQETIKRHIQSAFLSWSKYLSPVRNRDTFKSARCAFGAAGQWQLALWILGCKDGIWYRDANGYVPGLTRAPKLWFNHYQWSIVYIYIYTVGARIIERNQEYKSIR